MHVFSISLDNETRRFISDTNVVPCVSADRMRSDFGFSENDVSNIDKVIESLRELVSKN